MGQRGDGPVAVAGFIASQRVVHEVPQALSCRALGVSPAWFYKWRDGDPSAQHAHREKLKIEIGAVERAPLTLDDMGIDSQCRNLRRRFECGGGQSGSTTSLTKLSRSIW